MILIAIGIIIGLVVGLTGAGGALIAIPLFMQFESMSLKEASIYSLLAVVIASLSNFIFQREHAKIQVAALLVAAATAGSFFSTPYKMMVPDFEIALIISAFAIFALYSIWLPAKIVPKDASLSPPSIVQTVLLGFTLGIFTTLTGLGGGLLMLPALLRFFRLSTNEAVATSLLVVGLSSLTSFVVQSLTSAKDFQIQSYLNWNFLGLILSLLFTSVALKFAMTKASPQLAQRLRQVTFTIVVVISLLKIF